MAKHRQASFRAKTARNFGLVWQLEGERLTHSFANASPRLACVAKRFENRGLEVDSGASQISIPRVVEVQKRRKSYLVALALLPVFIVPTLLAGEPKQGPKREPACAFIAGKQLPSKVEITREVTLGGLSVLSLSCGGKRYSVTIDAKGAIVGSKPL